ncbi:hypothetical protein [Microvirga lotononidis]|uniref:Uncharacterized protein n=1 Tax=Microvirga lotononidis TaxID=864069 RepID=I4YQE7_9HYPH|nr:hypothetical protein [Microvirga lotononidis]EIM26189.1 hypothetical protein MicloDRAFT_00051470 [Microvirga lotononidis]WQO31495.1 hypothetical protein U0023_35035 [Microvirga lotononidis]
MLHIAAATRGGSISNAIPASLVFPNDPPERDAAAQIYAMNIYPMGELDNLPIRRVVGEDPSPFHFR